MTSDRLFTIIETAITKSIMSATSSIYTAAVTTTATVSTSATAPSPPPPSSTPPSSTPSSSTSTLGSSAAASSTRVPFHITTSIILTSLTSSVVGGGSGGGGSGNVGGIGIVHNGQSKRPTIILYPTVSPESVVIPIVSCIFGFPLLALLVICCLRRRAKLARERDRRRNYDLQDHAMSLVRFSPIHRLTNRSSRAISLRSERSMSRGFPSLELDTVLEEKSDTEQTNNDIVVN